MYILGIVYVTRSEKRDLRGKSEILHDERDERLKKSRALSDGVGDSDPQFLQFSSVSHSLFSYFSSGFIFSTTIFWHNPVSTKHVDSAEHKDPRRGRSE